MAGQGSGIAGGFDVYIRKCIENGKPIFPEKFSVGPDPKQRKTDLNQLKQSQGSFHFSAQYNNDPVDDDAIEFKRHWIRHYDVLPENGDDIMFIDPAFTEKKAYDFCGIVLTRITSENIVYVMQALALKLQPQDLIREIFRLHEVHKNIRKTYVESVAAQVMLLSLLKSEMLKRNKFFALDEFKPSTRENKASRIRGLIPRFESGGILLRRGLSDLENELLEFPRNTHDDLIDALSQGVNIWLPPSKIEHHEKQEGTFDWWKKKSNTTNLTRVGQYFRDMIPGAVR